MPDTWRDAILRPLAMASPDGGVYVELIAPDFRFAFALLLVFTWLVIARRGGRRISPALVLAGLAGLAFVPWLSTTGNGRYFIAFLMIAGPLCIGLAHLLPLTKAFRLTAALGMVLCQAFLIHQIDPWRTWGQLPWGNGPAFELAVPTDVAAKPATYVTLSSNSYSLIAPSFHPDSRWINVANLHATAQKAADNLRAQALFDAPGPLYAIFPTVPDGQKGERMDPGLLGAIDALLVPHNLSIKESDACRLMRSPSMERLDVNRKERALQQSAVLQGFWLCPLSRRASARPAESVAIPAAAEQVFEKLQRLCPRIFPSGAAVSLRIPAGVVRGYPDSDFKLYVLDDGRVLYKYYRALNSALLGTIGSVLHESYEFDCNNIRGRSGLPWEREI